MLFPSDSLGNLKKWDLHLCVSLFIWWNERWIPKEDEFFQRLIRQVQLKCLLFLQFLTSHSLFHVLRKNWKTSTSCDYWDWLASPLPEPRKHSQPWLASNRRRKATDTADHLLSADRCPELYTKFISFNFYSSFVQSLKLLKESSCGFNLHFPDD